MRIPIGIEARPAVQFRISAEEIEVEIVSTQDRKLFKTVLENLSLVPLRGNSGNVWFELHDLSESNNVKLLLLACGNKENKRVNLTGAFFFRIEDEEPRVGLVWPLKHQRLFERWLTETSERMKKNGERLINELA